MSAKDSLGKQSHLANNEYFSWKSRDFLFRSLGTEEPAGTRLTASGGGLPQRLPVISTCSLLPNQHLTECVCVFVFLPALMLPPRLISPLQRQAKYSENKLKCTKARNDYLLNLAATNAVVAKYYIHDVSDMIDVSVHVSC